MKLNLMSDTRFKKSNIESCEIEVDKTDCGPAGQYIGSKPSPKKIRWPRRGRRPRINNVLHRCGLPICRPAGALKTLAPRCFATDMSPRWGLRDHLANGGIHKRLRRSRGRQSKCRSYPRCYGRCNRPLYP